MNYLQQQISKVCAEPIRETIKAKFAHEIKPMIKNWVDSNLHRAKKTGHIELRFHFDDLDDGFPLFHCSHEESHYWQYTVTRQETDYIKGRRVSDVFISILVEDLCVKCDHPWPKA